MHPILWVLLGGATLLTAELVLRRWHDPLARDRTGDASQLPLATQRLQPRARRRAYRIVVLGDSIPFGWPLATHDGYPTRLEALLRARCPGRPIAVVNAGIGGHTAIMGLARVERDLVRWRPHLALIAFGLNDCHLARTALDERRERWLYARGRPAARLRACLRQSALLDLLRHLSSPLPLSGRGVGGEGLLPRKPSEVEGVIREEPRVSLAAYVAALRALVRTARRAGARPYLLTMTPLGPAALADPSGWRADVCRAYDRSLRRLAEEEQVAIIDLQAIFPQGTALEPLLAQDGVHLTGEGQELVAQAIASQLKL